jgi:Zn-dependent protease
MTTILVVLVVIVVSMTLHELAHGLVAYWLGDDTAKAQGRLTLNPIKHLDPFLSVALPLLMAISGGPIFGGAKPVPLNFARIKWGDVGIALVSAAGPLVNLLLAYIMFCLLYYVGPPSGSFWGSALLTGVVVNLGFFVFNLIPIPPLDGSRILFALAPDFVKRFMEQVERFGFIIVLVLVVIFSSFLTNIMSGAIGAILEFFNWLVV